MQTSADSAAADAMSTERPARSAWIDRLPPRAQLGLVVLIGLVAAGSGAGWLVLQHRLVEMQQQGRVLGAVESFFADGSSWATAWPGWAAAFFFLPSVLRLVRGNPEPPLGRGQSVHAMRTSLRREYRVVRIALAVVDVLAMLDLGRLGAYAVAAATHDALARGEVLTVAVESVGLLCAAVLLTVWMLRFRTQLESWGAL
jgi:hypothetical protein